MNEAFITSTGVFLPGPSIDNENVENILGMVNGKPSRLRSKILRSNGIKSRHYALNDKQQTTYQCSELATKAIDNCLERAYIDKSDVDMLAVGSTQGDLNLPGIASLVQAEADIPACEILSTHGVCSSGVMALKSAFNQIRLGEKQNTLVCASELASRLLKSSRYEMATDQSSDFEAEFLRWMLSDGAGAFLVQPKPCPHGKSLRIEWIEIMSYASDFDLCMSCGTADQSMWSEQSQQQLPSTVNSALEVYAKASSATTVTAPSLKTKSWQDYESYADAERHGALLIRQNLRILDNIVRVGVEGFLSLIKRGKITPAEIDHFVCHYSSHYFKGKILELFELSGCMVPEEKWFTNLYTKGNTGCASIFIALDELMHSGKLQHGDTIFCTVPESGRFVTAYMKLTVVEGQSKESRR